MPGLLIRCYLYCTDKNDGLDLVFFNVVKFGCAHYYAYILLKLKVIDTFRCQCFFTTPIDCTGAKSKLFDQFV